MAAFHRIDFNLYDLKYTFPIIRYIPSGPETGIACIYEGPLSDGLKQFAVVFRSNYDCIFDFYESARLNIDSTYNTLLFEFLSHCREREYFLL